MNVFLPNLPKGEVCLAAVGEEFSGISNAMRGLGIEVISVKIAPRLARFERSHPDMRIHHLEKDQVMVYREDKELVCALSQKGFSVCFAERQLADNYPLCAGLNACRIGNILVCNQKAIDPALRAFARQKGIELVFNRQGYARCAVCVVSENAAITSDPSVYSALKDRIDVLKISAGHIRLADTYDGMIGGCSGMIGENLLAFCGNIETHPDYKEIQLFLSKHKVRYVCLNNDELVDVGSLIPLKIKE